MSTEDNKTVIESLIRSDQNSLDSTLKKLFFLVDESLANTDRDRVHNQLIQIENLFRKTVAGSDFSSELLILYWEMSFSLNVLANAAWRSNAAHERLHELFRNTYRAFLARKTEELIKFSAHINELHQELVEQVKNPQDHQYANTTRHAYFASVSMIGICFLESA